MPITQYEERKKLTLWFALPKSALVACKRLLFENGLTLQEFFSQIIVMMENKDPVIRQVVQAAKINRIANAKRQMVFTNSKSLYAALEFKSPFRNKEG